MRNRVKGLLGDVKTIRDVRVIDRMKTNFDCFLQLRHDTSVI